jgi:DNA-binding response OmpR family regulator
MNNQPEQKILLIEDNPGDARLIQEMLNEITTFHYVLITAQALKEGCKHLQTENFILILLDLNLPDSSGKDTFDKVLKCGGQTPIVLVSGLQNLELSLSLIREGAQDYLTKPELNSNLLARTIEFAIERKKLLTQLKNKTNELERLNYYYVTRELKMNDMKDELNRLLEQTGERKRYT